MDGFRVLGVAIRREPWVFTLSTLGSVLFGALTVADAWVLGWATDHVVLPAFECGDDHHRGLVAILALFLGVAILRAVGIVARRLGAGIMQYRHAGALPPRGHPAVPRPPDGVAPAPPDRRAAVQRQLRRRGCVGADRSAADGRRHARDDGDRDRCRCSSPTSAMALVGLLVFPLVMLVNVVFQRLSSADLHPHPGAARRAERDRARVLRRRHGGQDARARGQETDRFAAKARELRDEGIRAGRIRAAFDPFLESLPNLGVLAVLGVGVLRVQSGSADPGDVVTVAYLLTIVAFPIRSIGWMLGEFPRSVVGLRPGPAGARHGQRHDVRRRKAGARPRGAALDVDDLGSPTSRPARARRPGLHDRARPDRGRGRATAPGRARSPRWSPGWSTRRQGTDPRRRPGPARPRSRPARASTCRWCRRARSCSTTRCAATSPWARTSRRGGLGGPAHRPGRRVRRRLPRASTAGWGSGGPLSPAVSASGCRWRARWSGGHACSCSTTRPRRSTPRSRRGSSPGMRRATAATRR